jgi:hypothetical protein
MWRGDSQAAVDIDAGVDTGVELELDLDLVFRVSKLGQ